ncbi:hypothetical protein JHK82_042834 [Glycine max]|nr:hypothetical protein JHK86_042850 [Glycine max]KAG4957096.1 hypothetical protein JHK85_043476 [Glycine max]KAG5105864.1 hypothetical protein JHK82_042834 [Glycine max]
MATSEKITLLGHMYFVGSKFGVHGWSYIRYTHHTYHVASMHSERIFKGLFFYCLSISKNKNNGFMAALELSCPNTISCSNILFDATCDLLTMLGGPFFLVFLGRCNGQTSLAFAVSSHLSTPSMPISQITQLFAKCGFTVEEFVALSGAHTIEFSHCFEFVTNLSNNTSSSYNPRYAQGLQKACADYKTNPTLSVFNDIMTSNKFYNAYL